MSLFPLKLGSGLVWMLVGFIFPKPAQLLPTLKTKKAFCALAVSPNPPSSLASLPACTESPMWFFCVALLMDLLILDISQLFKGCTVFCYVDVLD